MRTISLILAAVLYTGAVYGYDYPIKDPVEATVLGTPPGDVYQWQSPRAVKRSFLRIDLGKDLSEYPLPRIFGVSKLKLIFARQDKPAPLIFVIGGTGASYEAPKVRFLMNTFYQAGFHVITVSSPTKPDFIISASSTNMPGVTPYDARDLYRVMRLALDQVEKETVITARYVTGYSLGALDAAFIGALDKQRGEIDFDKVLMINPPVNLFTAVSNLDALITRVEKNYPGLTPKGLFDDVFTRIARYFKNTGGVIKFTSETLYELQNSDQALPLDQLELLIGAAYRFASADLAFMSDALNHTGLIVPTDERFTLMSGDLLVWQKRALRWSFVDYFYYMIMPWWQERYPQDSEEEVINKLSLVAIEDYLRDNEDVGVMTNSDDIILGPGDVDYLRDVFADRARIFPYGGHCGNMEYADNVEYMLDFFND